MTPDGVALLSRSPELVADVRRLCAAAGQQLRVVADVSEARQIARRVTVLLVDAGCPDLPQAWDHESLGDRANDVIVLTSGTEVLDPWRTAVLVGARRVISVPADSQRLLDALALAHEVSGSVGPLVAVVGGCGGVGASTVAVALACAAATRARATLVDLDCLGGGVDLLLGLERTDGLRWPDLTGARGVVPALALHERLPRLGHLAVLSCRRDDATSNGGFEIPLPALSAVVGASRRGEGAVIADIPRWQTAAGDALLSACDLVLLVVSAEVRAVAAAATTLGRLSEVCDDVRLVVRAGSRKRLGSSDVGVALGRAVVMAVPDDSRLVDAADCGDLAQVLRRSRLGRAAAAAWSGIGPDLMSSRAS